LNTNRAFQCPGGSVDQPVDTLFDTLFDTLSLHRMPVTRGSCLLKRGRPNWSPAHQGFVRTEPHRLEP
jgi:hypothetical protein